MYSFAGLLTCPQALMVVPKSILVLFLSLAFAFVAGCDGGAADPLSSASAGSGRTIESGDAGDPTHWTTLSADELWAHIAALDSTVTVGMKVPGERRGVDIQGRALMPLARWNAISHQFTAFGAEILSVDDFHPLVTLRLSGPGQITALRRSPFAEFVEPASFDAAEVLMDPVCGPSAPYQSGRTDPYGDIIPYTLDAHNVTQAWETSTGEGITIGIIDTGVSYYQPQLLEQFVQGMSAGRTIRYDWTDDAGQSGVPGWHDNCGHGTKTLGIAAAPRDGRNIVGVAYRANVFAIRALNSPAALGHWGEINRAIQFAADDSDIVSMSFGWSWGNSSVSNTIRHYYHNAVRATGRKTLFVAAAGSNGRNLSGIVFPAEMPEVLAVTGTIDGQTYCPGCHHGKELDFAAYTAGQTTGTNDGSTGDVDAIGKSSGAAPLLSGIAALVWSRFPNLSRDEVVTRLRNAGSRSVTRNDDIGYGVVDARLAVGPPDSVPGPLTSASIYGPSEVSQGQTTVWGSSVRGGTRPFAYRWTWNYTCSGGGGTVSERPGLGAPGTEGDQNFVPVPSCDTTPRSGGTGAQVSITPPDHGTIRISLEVTDAVGVTVEDAMNVTVLYDAPRTAGTVPLAGVARRNRLRR